MNHSSFYEMWRDAIVYRHVAPRGTGLTKKQQKNAASLLHLPLSALQPAAFRALRIFKNNVSSCN